MQPKLVLISGASSGRIVQLSNEPTTIGRDAVNIVAVSDPSVSRQHCVVVADRGQYRLRDLQSANGTFINDERVAERDLHDGDYVRFGETTALFVDAVRDAPLPEATELPAGSTSLRLEDALYLANDSDRLPPATRRTRDDLRSLLKISTALNSQRDRQGLHRLVLDALFEIVPAESGAILARVDADGDLVVQHTHTRAGEEAAPVSRTIVRRAVSDRAAVLSNNVRDSGFGDAPSVVAAQTRSVICVPLAVDDRIIGAIVLSASRGDRRFDEQHLQLVTAVGAISAVALERVRHVEWLESETRRLGSELKLDRTMVGDSAALRAAQTMIAKVAASDATVLIVGETGTGKELAARAIHFSSSRAKKAFVSINCAALTETLLESELFGHERGAFTDAIAHKRGKLEVADGGTMFLDEVGEMSPALQAKLLRALQEREFERVGGTRPIRVDFRLVSATNRDLQTAVAEGRFRQDLYFRLNVVTIAMPPLRTRRDDIPQLASYFLAKSMRKSARRVVGISPAAQQILASYDWPGNVRELENVLERAVVVGAADHILPEDLPDALLDSASGASLETLTGFHASVAERKKQIILDAMDRANGHVTEAARRLDLHPNYLHRLIRQFNLRSASKR